MFLTLLNLAPLEFQSYISLLNQLLLIIDFTRIELGFLGLFFDVQQSFILGQHALGFIFLAYIIIKNHRRLRVYPLLQQALVVCLYLLIYQSIMLLVMLSSGTITYTWFYWIPPFTSMLIWPWLFIFMRDFRRRNNVA